jgi:glycosyltransferase involved in cell wall biosynthesis
MTPLVSVVMPYLRAEATIGRAIDSVLSQTVADVELIAIGDGSTDGSADVVASCAARDARVRPLRLHRNHGPAYARNRAIEAARGAWIAVLDADDWFAPDRLRTLLDAAGDAAVVVDNLMGVDPVDGAATGPVYPSLPPTLTAAALVADAVPGARYNYGYLKPMVQKRFLVGNGLRYDETLRTAEDLLFLLECCVAGATVRTVDRPGYHYRLQVSPTTRRLSATTHSEPTDRAVADALHALSTRHAGRIDAETRDAIAARCAVLHRIADVSTFRHAVFNRRFVDALGLAFRSAQVRGYLWKKLSGASRS